MRNRTRLVVLVCLLACSSWVNATSCTSNWPVTKETAVREMYEWADVVALVESADSGLLAPDTAKVVAAWKGHFHDTVDSFWIPPLRPEQQKIWFAEKMPDWSYYGGGHFCTWFGIQNDEMEQFVREMFGEPTIEPTAYWVAEETAFYSILFLVLLSGSLGTLYTVTRGFATTPAVAGVGTRILRRQRVFAD